MVADPSGGGAASDAVVIAAPSVADPASSLALFLIVLAVLLFLSILVGRTVRSSTDSNRSAIDDGRTIDSSERAGGSASGSSPSSREVDSPGGEGGPDAPRPRSTGRVSTDEPEGQRERVVALLEREGGQIRQSRIVTETEWSKTKVSRLLSSMDEDDEVVKIQIGRENLICLPGHVPSVTRDEDG